MTWVGLAIVVVAFGVVTLAVLVGRGAILADDPPPEITEENMHLLPPFDPSSFPPYEDPPCVAEYEERYAALEYVKILALRDICFVATRDGIPLTSEEEITSYNRTREAAVRQENQRRITRSERSYQELLDARSVDLGDGLVIQLPDDVRIADITYKRILCVVNGPRAFCPDLPQVKLVRGEAEVWIDGHGRMYAWDDDDRDSFGFLEQYMPKAGK